MASTGWMWTAGIVTPVPLEGVIKMTGKPLLFWDNGMPEPLLVEGSNVWTLRYTGGKLAGRLICHCTAAGRPPSPS